MKRALSLLLVLTVVAWLAACMTTPQPDGEGSQTESSLSALSSSLQHEMSRASESSSSQSGSSSTAALDEGDTSHRSESSASVSASGSDGASSKPETMEESSEAPSASSETDGKGTSGQTEEMRGVWISYLELTTLLENKSAAAAKASIEDAFDRIAAFGLNTVFFQVRPFSDALYRSEYFPWSHILTGTQGVDPGYDPLAVAIEAAHARGLELHAWLNPYRVRASSKPELATNNPAYTWWNDDATKGTYVVQSGGGLYYNPAIPEVRELIVNGVREIIENYNVDGIHFDDYFYPYDMEDSFDAAVYAQSGTTLSLGDWRRSHVSAMVERVYATIKNYDSNIRFGISPSGNIDNTYGLLYADVYTWMSRAGYIDYICPQIYWGFEHKTLPYASTVKEWANLVTADGVDFYVGIAGYRIGEDGEWSQSGDLLARQIKTARQANRYAGFSIYSYTSLFISDSQLHRSEQQNVKDLLN